MNSKPFHLVVAGAILPFALPVFAADSAAARCAAGANCIGAVRSMSSTPAALPQAQPTDSSSASSNAPNDKAAGGTTNSVVSPSQAAARAAVKPGNSSVGNVNRNANIGGAAASGNVAPGNRAAVGQTPGLGNAATLRPELEAAREQGRIKNELGATQDLINTPGRGQGANGPQGFDPGQWDAQRMGESGEPEFRDPLGETRNEKPSGRFGIGANTSLPGKGSLANQGGTQPGSSGDPVIVERHPRSAGGGRSETGGASDGGIKTTNYDRRGNPVSTDVVTPNPNGSTTTTSTSSDGRFTSTETRSPDGVTRGVESTRNPDGSWSNQQYIQRPAGGLAVGRSFTTTEPHRIPPARNVDPDSPSAGGGPREDCKLNPNAPGCKTAVEEMAENRRPGDRVRPDDNSSERAGAGGVVRLGRNPGDPDPQVVNPDLEARPSGSSGYIGSGYNPNDFKDPPRPNP